ncbi:glutamate--tRNA ligase [Limnobacter profundi]|jgi:glutamyl-tRNA synthetase|uniref:Glutamate--tRNA ligase n=1 Tax=Limnobacter profundi TaxID=2732163 RepID=A0ABX6N488_9BURK|nr:glutamate--tRNA ligase [Limnobacter sp. SAORIC-580]PZO18454.1 MAG: glutamate--tRNA ligase [Betaproteobacteria bacterium]PZO24069.1 MAG: glutamate--tRNA ligase [Betaproteobacteria bacterium]PZO26322.1 MAG: glutamate--tRNA ligase [Betaproteobacteria bacterium]QJR29205.1 glutamate--tRNA ligase [Limnobacter sp. SAORIC-580]
MSTDHQNQTVRTRFAPSPTGYLHLGGARTALYSWAFARHHKGQFILRVEDTDVERSTPEAVQAIMDGMAWLNLDYDEGPFFQMQRMDRYRAMIDKLLEKGDAYLCYCTQEELNQMREKQRENGQRIRYDGTWRPEAGKVLPTPPADVKPVVRFKNPLSGAVTWDDLVKGAISINNEEMDDLIIARQDGTPTYNFCVVVDDWEMKITHVIRGDDHINNTPRQINILKALGGDQPIYGHIPMILGPDGEKLSKRHGAVSVVQYHEEGFLPDAMINYLARLGWSHGDDELFSREQLIEWFDSTNLSKSAAQFDPEKLKWVNAHYMKQAPKEVLLSDLQTRLEKEGVNAFEGPKLADVLDVVLERASTLVQLRDEAALFYKVPSVNVEELKPMLEEAGVRAALAEFNEGLNSVEWNVEALSGLVKTTIKNHGLKMPKLAMPLRLMLTGITQTPSIDKVMNLLGKHTVQTRIAQGLQS